MLSFGVEIECFSFKNMDRCDEFLFSYGNGELMEWICGGDGSLRLSNADIAETENLFSFKLNPIEIRSRVYREDEFEQFKKDMNVVYDKLVKYTNRTCGFHIHVSSDSQDFYSFIPTWEFADMFQKSYLNDFCEDEEEKFRLTENRFCQSWKSKGNFQRKANERYRSINLTSYYKYRTIEFRVFKGYSDGKRAIEAVEFVIDKINNWIKQKDGLRLRKEVADKYKRNHKVNKGYYINNVNAKLSKKEVIFAREANFKCDGEYSGPFITDVRDVMKRSNRRYKVYDIGNHYTYLGRGMNKVIIGSTLNNESDYNMCKVTRVPYKNGNNGSNEYTRSCFRRLSVYLARYLSNLGNDEFVGETQIWSAEEMLSNDYNHALKLIKEKVIPFIRKNMEKKIQTMQSTINNSSGNLYVDRANELINQVMRERRGGD